MLLFEGFKTVLRRGVKIVHLGQKYATSRCALPEAIRRKRALAAREGLAATPSSGTDRPKAKGFARALATREGLVHYNSIGFVKGKGKRVASRPEIHKIERTQVLVSQNREDTEVGRGRSKGSHARAIAPPGLGVDGNATCNYFVDPLSQKQFVYSPPRKKN